MNLLIYFLFICLIAGFVFPLIPRRKDDFVIVSLRLAGLGGLAALVSGVVFLLSPAPVSWTMLRFPPLVAGFPVLEISFYADKLAAVFLILTGGLGLAASLHMSDWLEGTKQRRAIAAVFNLFLLSILLTILANTVYYFLFSLECITLTYAYLVLYRHNEYVDRKDIPPGAIEASKTAFKAYLIFEHVGLALLTVAFMLLSIHTSSVNGFNFEQIRSMARQESGGLAGTTANLVFILGLLGFGIKAGAFPVHVWVPVVHPYSPTSIHAMMSGVVLEVAGIYGMYRLFFEFSGPGEFWWGLLVMVLAAVSALVGVFYALVGRDLKSVLASHTVEHIGIIMVGIGIALICRWAANYALDPEGMINSTPWSEVNQPAVYRSLLDRVGASFLLVEMLALVASLYHLINHSIFKSLLFFATGAIENRTGTTVLDRLGGLVKRYPWTSATFIIGAVSIAGFPPFNGFISEWLTLQALFSSMNLFLPGMVGRISLLVGIVFATLFLALAFGITALAFVKITGEALLGAPRDLATARQSKPREVSWNIRSVLVALAGLCLVFGLFPAPVASGLNQVVADFLGEPAEAPLHWDPGNLNLNLPIHKVGMEIDPGNQTQVLFVRTEGYTAQISGTFLWALVMIILLPFLINLVMSSSKKWQRVRLLRGPVWTGGEPYLPETMQYTGSAFSAQVWSALEDRKTGSIPRQAAITQEDEKFLPAVEQVTSRRAVVEVFRHAYAAGARFLVRIAQRVGDWAQPGDIRRYLFYIFTMFILSLVLFLMISGTVR